MDQPIWTVQGRLKLDFFNLPQGSMIDLFFKINKVTSHNKNKVT